MTTSEVLFGTRLNPVSHTELAKLLGVSPRTISNWKKDPDTIPWGKMREIIRIRKLTGDDIVKMSKERRQTWKTS